jgi:hypothetical protein
MHNGEWRIENVLLRARVPVILHWKGMLPVGATTARMRVVVTLMVAL